jgi:hypothetical protein
MNVRNTPIRPGLLTQAQFDEAARRTEIGPVWRNAAELVLVRGYSQAEAARRAGIKHRNGAYLAVQVIRRALTQGERCSVCGNELRGEHTHQHDERGEK